MYDVLEQGSKRKEKEVQVVERISIPFGARNGSVVDGGRWCYFQEWQKRRTRVEKIGSDCASTRSVFEEMYGKYSDRSEVRR